MVGAAVRWGHHRDGFTLGPGVGGGSASFDGEGDSVDLDVNWIPASVGLNWYF